MLRRLHFCYNLMLFIVPQQDGVIKARSDDFGCVRDFFVDRAHHLAGLKDDDFDDCVRVSFHIMSFNTFLDLVRFKSIVCLNKKVASLLHDFNLSYAFFDQLF